LNFDGASVSRFPPALNLDAQHFLRQASKRFSTMIVEPQHDSRAFTRCEELNWLNAHYSTGMIYVERGDVGLGVFANRDIAREEVILSIEGPTIDFAETKRRGPWECMALQIGDDKYIDTCPPGVFVNHSCDPNAGIREDNHLVAIRGIRKGEEIRYDYSTTMDEQSFTMRCLCRANECRNVVGDFSTIPPQVRERYISLGIVMSFILKRMGCPKRIARESGTLIEPPVVREWLNE